VKHPRAALRQRGPFLRAVNQATLVARWRSLLAQAAAQSHIAGHKRSGAKRDLVHFMEPARADIIGTSAFISSRSQKVEEDYRKDAYNASARSVAPLRRDTEEPHRCLVGRFWEI
jgi:hypothetical protein